MKAKLTDEAHKSALAKLSGWSEVGRQRCRLARQRDALCSLGNDVLCSYCGAPFGPTVELRDFGATQCDELSVTYGLAFGVPLLRDSVAAHRGAVRKNLHKEAASESTSVIDTRHNRIHNRR
jgi:hypothetical protein